MKGLTNDYIDEILARPIEKEKEPTRYVVCVLTKDQDNFFCEYAYNWQELEEKIANIKTLGHYFSIYTTIRRLDKDDYYRFESLMKEYLEE